MGALSAKLNLARKKMTKEKISYNNAIVEIESILELIEEGKLDVDIEAACRAKMDKNAEKYPVERVKGSASKYTTYKN